MSQYSATITWQRNGAMFTDSRYSRGHSWHFDGGLTIPASCSPDAVWAPFAVVDAVDPEEAFVAALASCHMLWFLHIAAKQGFVVENYRDEATGVMAKNADGKLAITEVTLRPRVTFVEPSRPSTADHEAMHHDAHQRCFIANSVKTDVRCQAIDIAEQTQSS
jgi:organic hydroperoxide reductase OsmC/OhrA